MGKKWEKGNCLQRWSRDTLAFLFLFLCLSRYIPIIIIILLLGLSCTGFDYFSTFENCAFEVL